MTERRSTICLLAVTGMLIATVAVSPQTRPLAITGINVVDVIDGRIIQNATVTIRGTTIADVAPGGKPSGDARLIDGHGLFLIPGLWDMHTHMDGSGPAWLPLHVANGVTGIRDMGSDLDVILKMREGVATGGVLGPRIFAAGPILDDPPAEWPFRLRVKTAEDGRKAVKMLKRRGVDLIKVHNYTPRDAFLAIAEEARRQHLPLAGHVPVQVTTEEAVEAGQNDIEHLSESRLWMACSHGETYRAEDCRPLFAMLATRGIWQTPTLIALSELITIGTPASSIPADRLAYAPRRLRGVWADIQSSITPTVVQKLKNRAKEAAVATNDLARAGVPMLTGCDSMIAGFCVHDEVALMVRAGMTPLAALQAATLNPARYFNLSETAGRVAAGRRADLVLLDANPLADIANVRRIRAVVVAGRFLDRSELDTLLAEARAAASRS